MNTVLASMNYDSVKFVLQFKAFIGRFGLEMEVW